MDHLQEAKQNMDMAQEWFDEDNDEYAMCNIELAKAHALIEIAERLEKIRQILVQR